MQKPYNTTRDLEGALIYNCQSPAPTETILIINEDEVAVQPIREGQIAKMGHYRFMLDGIRVVWL